MNSSECAAAAACPASLDAGQMASIFPQCVYLPVPQEQSTEAASSYLHLFESYIARCRSFDDLYHTWKRFSISDPGTSHFFPQYGCAIICSTSVGCYSNITMHLYILGLDNWEFYLCAKLAQQHTFTSLPHTHELLFAGNIPATLRALFWTKFSNKLADAASSRTREKRSAATNEQGHQRTPAFINALVQDTIYELHHCASNDKDEDPPLSQPRGGFTDVGLHTGGVPRDTAWPLACAVLHFAFEQSLLKRGDDSTASTETLRLEYLRFMLHFKMWLVESVESRFDLDTVLRMLDVVICETVACVELYRTSFDASELLTRASSLCDRVEHRHDTASIARAKEFELPLVEFNLENPDKDNTGLASYVHPSMSLPKALCLSERGKQYELAKERAERNVSWLPLLLDSANKKTPIPFPVADLHAWMQNERLKVSNAMQQHSGYFVMQLLMSSVERWVFALAEAFLPTAAPSALGEDLLEFDQLVTVLYEYRRCVQAYRQSDEGKLVMQTEMRSRETLVVWIVYCLADRNAVNKHPLLGKYNISLLYGDLAPLVLSDKTAYNVMLLVCNYLCSRSGDRPVFSGRSSDASFSFAKEFAKASPSILEQHNRETAKAEEQIEGHWRNVQTMKERLARLRIEYQELEDKWQALRQELSGTSYHDAGYNSLSYRVDAANSARNQKARNVAAAESAPPPLILALPRNADHALCILFFLYMPPAFKLVAQLSFTAQQMLVPRPYPASLITTSPRPTVWAAHYYRYSNCTSASSTLASYETPLCLSSTAGLPGEKAIYPSKLDSINSAKEINMWAPDSLIASTKFCWQGGNFGLDSITTGVLNPFLVTEGDTADFYTEKLPEKFASLQWAMRASRNPHPTRGNVAIAESTSPPWLSRPQYLMLSAVRAYPHLQLRKLCVAIKQRTLPFAHPSVHLLLCSTLQHVGELAPKVDNNQTIAAVWKYDLEHGDGLATLIAELDSLADALASKIREHPAFLFLVDAIVYLRHWDSLSSKDMLRRKFVQIALNGAKEKSAEEPAIRAQQCIFYMYALLAFGGSFALEEQDVREVCILAARVHLGKVEEPHCIAEEKDLFRSLVVRTQHVLCSRLPFILSVANAHADVLNATLRTVIDWAPSDLKWGSLLAMPTGCFQAISTDGHIFTLNLLTGAVLVDGAPPSSLPADVLAHPLYVRTFGKRDFRVTTLSSGILRTNNPNEIDYDFYIDGSVSPARLYVTEVTRATGQRLELLDVATIDQWAPALPPRLGELHSHWLNRADKKFVLFRPINYDTRTVDFLYLEAPSPRYVRVPSHLRSQPVTELVRMALAREEALRDHLVLWRTPPPPLLRILTKFEDPRYIHSFLVETPNDPKNKKLKISLPRFKLEFEVAHDKAQHSFVVKSDDFADFRLCSCQQLSDTLGPFTSYLLLYRGADENSDVKMIIPVGLVDGDGKLVFGAYNSAAERKWTTYSIHKRFGDLRARDIASRLQLAALYSATSVSLPDKRRRMTGVEIAIELLRGCFTNAPLQANERSQLKSIEQFFWKSPTLFLLCRLIEHTSRQVKFLWDREPSPMQQPEEDERDLQLREQDCLIEYRQYCTRAIPNLRLLLTPEEEERLCGIKIARKSCCLHKQSAPSERSLLSLGVAPVDCHFVPSIDRALSDMVASNSTPVRPAPAAILGSTKDDLEGEMLKELRESWETYCEQPVKSLGSKWRDPAVLCSTFETFLKQVCTKRNEMQTYLLGAVQKEPTDEATYEYAVTIRRLLRACHRVPLPTMRDLVSSIGNARRLVDFNFFLSVSALDRRHITNALLVWMELCVLDDKLNRLLLRVCDLDCKADKVPAPIEAELIRDLQSSREWQSEEYPLWLAFEIDAMLQIRPMQYRVARTLIEHPGAIVQLNMGEGKTRVILPMLILYWTSMAEKKRPIVRLHLLAELLSEAYEYLHECLCAGVLSKKLFLMPFHRDVELTRQRVHVMSLQAKFCQREGGALLVTPEHRCSLQLKRQELHCSKHDQDLCDSIAKFEELPYCDIIDESDELLRQKLQVIYAIGTPLELPSLEERCVVVQAVLQQLHKSKDVRALLTANPLAVLVDVDSSSLERFYTTLRFIPGPQLDVLMPRLVEALARSVLSNEGQVYELNWLPRLGVPMEMLIRYVIDAKSTADHILTVSSLHGNARHRDVLLALRGLFAHGLFYFCFIQRHRVFYGLRSGGIKRLAVPYRACDVPSERCEFAQPDNGILLTHLAYLYDGLKKEQLVEALRKLLSCGLTAQKQIYSSWLEQSCKMLTTQELASIDSPDKIDLTNASQVEVLERGFSRNMYAIFYWLRFVALPVDTQQYEGRIKASAWNVSGYRDKRQAPVGFSGTNDNHRLLPLHVKTVSPKDVADLRATNGRMLALLLDHASYEVLPPQFHPELRSWKLLLYYAIAEKRASALIDAGALLAGASAKECAKYASTLLRESKASLLRGVVYFSDNVWWMRSLDGSICALNASPIPERDAFVLFDEQHCRGADMRLRYDANAVLTLGPRMCKDKLMQAAGRMWQLGRRQKLVLVAMQEIHLCISDQGKKAADGTVDVERVLKWVVANTVQYTTSGLLEWAANGVHYLVTEDALDRAVTPEITRLDELYQHAVDRSQLCNVVREIIQKRCSADWRTRFATQSVMLNTIEERAQRFGAQMEVVASAVDEECERELERQTEKEEEVEKQVAKQAPAAERDWDYALVLRGWSDALESSCGAVSLSNAVKLLGIPELGHIKWKDDNSDSKERVYCTKNFLYTIASISSAVTMNLASYLRPVDTFVLFATEGIALLLCDREANSLIPLLRSVSNAAAAATKRVLFVHVDYARPDTGPRIPLSLPIIFDKKDSLEAKATSATLTAVIPRLLVFNGETTFDRNMWSTLRLLVADKSAKDAALLLPRLRGYQQKIPRSDLETICEAELPCTS